MTKMFFLPRFPAPHRGRIATTTALTGGVLSGLLVFVAVPVPAAAQNALPTSGVVASGAASMGTSAGALTINQTSARAVINWQGFSVGQGNSVTFAQPDASSATLNRVTGATSSTIAGSINANGQVFLVNPNGIAITATGSVNAGGGFAGSTLDIADRDFNAGNLNFRGGGASASVTNQGAITTGSGGFVGLLGATVSNTGTIDVPLGRVGLGSGEQATIDPTGTGFLQVALPTTATAPDGKALVDNAGRIRAAGGRIELKAATAAAAVRNAVNISGSLSAHSVSGRDGAIVLGGGEGGDVAISGTVSASGRGSAGQVAIGGRLVNISAASAKVKANSHTGQGGSIAIRADQVVNTGALEAKGASGGSVSVAARSVGQYGSVDVSGSTLRGGLYGVEASGGYIETAASQVKASGPQGGGTVDVKAASLFSSGATDASSADGTGGAITLTAQTMSLVEASYDASGATGGGAIRVGGGFRGLGTLAHADEVLVSAGTRLSADATQVGEGGTIVVWSDAATQFYGHASARGAGGNGGAIEISSAGTLTMGGTGDAGAGGGNAGTLLLDPKNIVIDDTQALYPQYQLIDPNSSAGNLFGASVTVLGTTAGGVFTASGNVVVTASGDSFGGTGAGAVYLYNKSTGALISTLTGSQANDKVGLTGVSLLANGNYVVTSAAWANGAATLAGAVTWGNSTTGVTGTVSAGNSLVGTQASDKVGTTGVSALTNGNYVVNSSSWANGAATAAGAVTWGNGSTGVTGAVSAGNSLVGSQVNDKVGTSLVTALTNGNYVVRSTNWANGAATAAGAVTWGNGSTGVTGAVSAGNSLVGSQANDKVGASGVTALTNGNYVVDSASWANGAATLAGAATWGDGSTGVTGAVSASNSLVGSQANDKVGADGVTSLGSGNYVVNSSSWANGAATAAGAVTWGNGSTGVTGAVSAGNSLVGSQANDQVGSNGITLLLSNGNYVVRSVNWANGAATLAGAVTWGSGTIGVKGAVSAGNSLVGSQANDKVGFFSGAAASAGSSSPVTALRNGNYVVSSSNWANGAATQVGAATWGNGTTGVSGTISASNSLVGTTSTDQIANGGVLALTNGNYVVSSYVWNDLSAAAVWGAGAATWGNGTTGVTGNVSASNSLIGTGFGAIVGNGLYALPNGNYVVRSDWWGDGTALAMGASTWGNGATGVTGVVSASNSLVGSKANDHVAAGGITILPNGNYVVYSNVWASGAATKAGAVTWASGTGGVTGVVSASNSLVGAQTNDLVGSGGITALTNGNYVVRSASWGNGAATLAGAVTWGNGSTGVTGAVSAGNSLVGSQANDQVGSLGITLLSNGNYVVRSTSWANGAVTLAGAVTWGSGGTGVAGVISANNSLVGSHTGDRVGSSGVQALANGNYVVVSPIWANGGATLAGAVTWGSGATGVTGAVSSLNSLVGTVASATLSYVTNSADSSTFIARSPTDGTNGGGRVFVGISDLSALTYSRAQSQTVTIGTAGITGILATGTALTLQASNDITLNSALTVPGAGGGALTLSAGRSLLLNASITTANGNLNLIANDTLADGVVNAQRDTGAAVITMASGTSIDAGSGSVSMNLMAGADKTNATGGAITLRNIVAASVTVANNAGASGSNIAVSSAATLAATGDVILIATGSGTITNAGTISQGGSGSIVLTTANGALTNSSTISGGSTAGAITLTTTGTGAISDGSGTITQAGTGAVTLRATGTGAITADAINYSNAAANTLTIAGPGNVTLGRAIASTGGALATTVTAAAGTITLSSALSTAGGALNVTSANAGSGIAVSLDGASTDVGTGVGTIAGASTSGDGVQAIGGNVLAVTGPGRLTLSGSSASAGSTGVRIEAGQSVTTSGAVTLTDAAGSLATTAIRIAGTLNEASGKLTLAPASSGDILIASGGVLAGAGTGEIALATTGTGTIANSGTFSLVAGSRYIVFADDASKVGLATLPAATHRFGVSTASYLAGTTGIDATGNFRLYRNTPVLSVAADAKSRLYGAANPALTYTFSGFVDGDTSALLSGSLFNPAATSTGVGTSAIMQGSLAVGGGYAISYTGALLTINQAALTITASNRSKTYGTTASLGTTAFTHTGLLNADTISGVSLASAGSVASASVNGGAGYAINASSATGTGLSNYTITYAGGALTVDRAALTITASNRSKTYGTTVSLGTSAFTQTGLVNGDTVSGVTLASDGSVAAASVNGGAGYAIHASSATGTGLSNYTITYAGGARLTVDARPIAVIADAKERNYGVENPALTYAIGGSGLVNGDRLTGALATAATSASPVGSYGILRGSLAASANYDLTYVSANLTIDKVYIPSMAAVVAREKVQLPAPESKGNCVAISAGASFSASGGAALDRSGASACAK